MYVIFLLMTMQEVKVPVQFNYTSSMQCYIALKQFEEEPIEGFELIDTKQCLRVEQLETLRPIQ